MRSYEPDESNPASVVEAHDKPVPVSTDVENDAILPDNARISVIRLH